VKVTTLPQVRSAVTRETLLGVLRVVEDTSQSLIDENVRLENKLRTVSAQLEDALDEINAQRDTIRARDELIAELQEMAAKLRRKP
jgi:hypothetical protein